jgi:threonine/homoserine/homoserine lactone efflux protein
MNYWFFLKCFLIGVSVSSAVGPIFVLTFNRGSLYGFGKGFVTALGSAIADGFLFLLGSFGLLSIVQESEHLILLMDLVGGLTLIFFGVRLLRGDNHHYETKESLIPLPATVALTIGKSFFITVLNPLALLFFMFASVQIVPEGVERLCVADMVSGSLMIALGSLTVLSAVAFGAHRIGKSINTQHLNLISYITGIVLIGIGCYFLTDLLRLVLMLFV